MSALLDSPSRPRSPWQLLYSGAHRLRRAWYERRGLGLPRPVISVGNLHWGGSGKTPLVSAVAGHLRDQGRRVAILSRGYGGRGEGVRVVGDGHGPRLGPLVAGDEPVQLAGELPGVAVVVGADRHAAGRAALERLDPAPDLFLLDDGFSHLRLHRDLDLLAFPFADPFARGRLLPSGRLREPLAAARRAHAALLTGAPPDPGWGDALADALRPHGFEGPGFAAPVEILPPRREDGAELPPGSRVLAVSGIARPEGFARAVESSGMQLVEHLVWPDHHPYPSSTLDRIRERWNDGLDAVLCTAKDRVKLAGRLELPLAELPLRSRPEPAFWKWLDERVAELPEG